MMRQRMFVTAGLSAALAVLAAVLVGTRQEPAEAALSNSDQNKLKRQASVYLNPWAPEKDRIQALEEFAEFFAPDSRKAAELADVEGLGAVMAHVGERPRMSSGVSVQEFSLSPVFPTFTYTVSVPKDYRNTDRSDPMPLVICLPDRPKTPFGATPEQARKDSEKHRLAYLDANWGDSDLRNTCLIAVLDFDYADRVREVEEELAPGEEDGEAEKTKKTVKVPFTWDDSFALQRFWHTYIHILTKQFRVDPNRIFLDGRGIGANGVLHLGAGNAFRFAGIIVRDGEYDSPALGNLAHTPVAVVPSEGAGEGTAKALEELKKAAGDLVTNVADAKALAAWIGQQKRSRYPLPSSWVSLAGTDVFSPWSQIREKFDPGQPARITIASGRTAGAEKSEDGNKEDAPKKTANRIEVTTENVSEFIIYLNDLLVDMDKPFQLWVNGEMVGDYQKARSAEMMLAYGLLWNQSGKPPYDPGCVFTQELGPIRVKAPPKPAEAAGDEKPGENGRAPDGEKPADAGNDPGAGGEQGAGANE